MDSNHQKYIISLDAVDVNIMPVNLKRSYDHVIPIWTKGNLNLRDDEYYQFEIRNEEEFEDLQKGEYYFLYYSNSSLLYIKICNLK